MKLNILKGLAMTALATGFVQSAEAISVDWSGTYRFEYMELDNVKLGDPGARKSYFLNHLSLSPKIIAADGFNVVSKFEILPNQAYPDSYLGQPFGAGAWRGDRSNPQPNSGSESSVNSSMQRGYNLQVSQLYLNVNQEFGALLVGRAPLDFGLGIAHNSGSGLFDHWYDLRDMVAYKFFLFEGKLAITPIIGKVYDYSIAAGREASDQIWKIEYDNPDTKSAIGIFYQQRKASKEANDTPAEVLGGTGATVTGSYDVQTTNIYLYRGWDKFDFKLEAAFLSGSTGVSRADLEGVKMNGFGVATEMNFLGDPKNLWSLRTGLATGDNPDTANYEGFHFDRNYDVAMLLFNHPMGRADIFRTRFQRNTQQCTTPPCAIYDNEEAADEETISNVFYLSPKYTNAISEKWDWTHTLTWAQLQTAPYVGVDAGKDVGFEYDMGFTYKPNDKVRWVNELGLFFPGSAWKGDGNYSNNFTYGFTSKAAISF